MRCRLLQASQPVGCKPFLISWKPTCQRPSARAGEVLIRILNGTLFELVQLARENAGLKPLEQDDRTRAFMTQAVLSLSDAVMYPAPMAFELKDFTQVQASVFQVARAPARTLSIWVAPCSSWAFLPCFTSVNAVSGCGYRPRNRALML